MSENNTLGMGLGIEASGRVIPKEQAPNPEKRVPLFEAARHAVWAVATDTTTTPGVREARLKQLRDEIDGYLADE